MAAEKEEAVDGGVRKPLFRALDAQIDLDEMETSVIESLCMKCFKKVRVAICTHVVYLL